MDVLDDALTRYPDMRCVVMTGFGGVEDAVRAIKRGAIDFLIKPFQLAQLAQILKTSLQRAPAPAGERRTAAQLHDRFRFDNIIGASPAMQRLFTTLELVAPMNSTVLIQGETGTGKELIARTIHHNSPRRDQQFVAFNAAAIPEGLAEAELFGHVKGAFTGAVNSRVGRFELAHRGTLFIDEVASMSMSLQAKLLRALQEREVERVGASKPVKFDIRVDRGDQRRPDGAGQGGHVPRRSLLPPERRARHAAAAARAARGHPAAGAALRPEVLREQRPAAEDAQPGGAARADGLLVARQHPPARERDRARAWR